jgi:hypothetical protein
MKYFVHLTGDELATITHALTVARAQYADQPGRQVGFAEAWAALSRALTVAPRGAQKGARRPVCGRSLNV